MASKLASLSATAGLLLTSALAFQSLAANEPASVPNFAPNSVTAWVPDRSAGDDFLCRPAARACGLGQGSPLSAQCRHSGPIDLPRCRSDQSDPQAVGDRANAQGKRRGACRQDPVHGARALLARRRPLIDIYERDRPIYFMQTPKEVLIVTEHDAQVRHIYMNVPHSPHPKTSWYGESVGHYEGETLVVDTIGMNDKSFVDNYRTPHTTQIHVVERFRLVDSGKTLEALIRVEDPGAFNMPWSAVQRWRRREGNPILELVCAENSRGYFGYDVRPIPQATRLDF